MLHKNVVNVIIFVRKIRLLLRLIVQLKIKKTFESNAIFFNCCLFLDWQNILRIKHLQRLATFNNKNMLFEV